MADNPSPTRPTASQRLVLTYGHRNVQGLAQRRRRHACGQVEHGSYRDDEVNRLVAGGDYGWNPVPGYNESVPMTDQSLPGPALGALEQRQPDHRHLRRGLGRGQRRGSFNGTLAVAALKGNAGAS